jgi:hypothetical protein
MLSTDFTELITLMYLITKALFGGLEGTLQDVTPSFDSSKC